MILSPDSFELGRGFSHDIYSRYQQSPEDHYDKNHGFSLLNLDERRSQEMGQMRGAQNERQNLGPLLQPMIGETLRAGSTLRTRTCFDRYSQTTPYDHSCLMTPSDRSSQTTPFDRSSQTTPSNRTSYIPPSWPARSEGDLSAGYEMKLGDQNSSMSSENWDRYQEPRDFCFTKHDDSMYSLQGQGPWQHSGFQRAKSTEFRPISAQVEPARYSVAERVKTPWSPPSGTFRSFSNARPRKSQSWYHEENQSRCSRASGDPAVFTMLDCLVETPPTASPDEPHWQQPGTTSFERPTITPDWHYDETPNPNFSPADTARNSPPRAADQGDLSAFKFPTSGLGRGYAEKHYNWNSGEENVLRTDMHAVEGHREGEECYVAPDFDETQNRSAPSPVGDLEFRPEEVSFEVRTRAW